MELNIFADAIEKYKLKLTEEQVLDFLRINHRWNHRNYFPVEVINNLKTIETKSFYNINGEFVFDSWYDYFKKGFTSIISNVLDLNHDLRKFREFLHKHTGTEMWCNFYFSRPGNTPSFGGHKHEYDVIVKQIYGKTTWLIGKQIIVLQPQKTLVIPKGFVHQVVDKAENKLSLTMNLE
tara:strand:+ start:489 stop:1025 length:537 start_codon:yes stop_codon:yes gene_type:complete